MLLSDFNFSHVGFLPLALTECIWLSDFIRKMKIYTILPELFKYIIK